MANCPTCGQPIKPKQDKTEHLLRLVNETLGRQFRVLPRGAGKIIILYKPSEVTMALKNMATNPWLQAHPQGLDYLLRPTTIDMYLTTAPTPRFE